MSKKDRRADPNVGGLTRLRDEIRERRRTAEPPHAAPKAEPNYKAEEPWEFRRLRALRRQLRNDSLSREERRRLEALETHLSEKLDR